MAALQGKGAFGGPPPPVAPKPNVERPKWKQPPSVPAPEESIAAIDEDVRETSRSPPPRAVASPVPENQPTSNREGESDPVVQEGDGGDPDQEEEERQRRAAIAARMARLGGAHFGMGPPIFAPKPVARKSEPAPSADEATNQEVPADQSTVAKESTEALVTSPSPDLPSTAPPVPEAAATIEHKDEVDPPLPMPARVPTSMPVPAGPRRAAPPRKKPSKNAPAGPLPEPPAEEAEVAAVQLASVIVEPHTGIVDDAPLAVEVSQKETSEVAGTIETTHDEHVNITTDPEHTVPGSEAFYEPVEEPSHQEGVEELVECAVVHAGEESTHTGAEDQAVQAEQPSGAVEPEAEEDADEEVRRQRVAARLAQMGAFNPLTGPPPIPQRSSFDEQAVATPSKEPLDVEDEVNVDTEEHRETISPPPASPARQGTVPPIEHDAAGPDVGIDQDDAKVDEDDQAPAHDGES